MPAKDRSSTQDGPATGAEPITPSNTVEMDAISRGIYVGVGGDIVVVPASGDGTILFKGAVAGSIIPIRAKRVNATGTTATDLVSLY